MSRFSSLPIMFLQNQSLLTRPNRTIKKGWFNSKILVRPITSITSKIKIYHIRHEKIRIWGIPFKIGYKGLLGASVSVGLQGHCGEKGVGELRACSWQLIGFCTFLFHTHTLCIKISSKFEIMAEWQDQKLHQYSAPVSFRFTEQVKLLEVKRDDY